MKLKVIVADPDIKVRTLIKKNFEDNFGAVVFDIDNFKEAKHILDNEEGISLIISKNNSDTENLASQFLNYVYDHDFKPPLLVIGDFDHAYKKYALVSDKLRIEEINRLSLKALNLKKEDFSFLKLPDYIPYPLQYFYLLKKTAVDLYIKIKKSDGEDFVKRFKALDPIEEKDLIKYEELGVSDLYVLKSDREIMLNDLLTSSIKELKAAPLDKKLEILNDTFSISADMLRKVGITPEAKIICDQTIVHIAASVSKTDKLGELLIKILNDEYSFSYRRSYLISLICAQILPKLDWVNGEQRQVILLKLTMVSFFHDIYLDDENLLRIMTIEEIKAVNNILNFTEKDAVMNHAQKAALLLQSYPKLPSGVDIIVKQHHGVSNGVGFPESFSSAISPLAIVFLVVEDFAHHILCADKINIEDILKKLGEKYTLPSYRKILQEINSLYKPN